MSANLVLIERETATIKPVFIASLVTNFGRTVAHKKLVKLYAE